MTTASRRFLLVGMDGMNLPLLRRFEAEGCLPNFSRLMSRGSTISLVGPPCVDAEQLGDDGHGDHAGQPPARRLDRTPEDGPVGRGTPPRLGFESGGRHGNDLGRRGPGRAADARAVLPLRRVAEPSHARLRGRPGLPRRALFDRDADDVLRDVPSKRQIGTSRLAPSPKSAAPTSRRRSAPRHCGRTSGPGDGIEERFRHALSAELPILLKNGEAEQVHLLAVHNRERHRFDHIGIYAAPDTATKMLDLHLGTWSAFWQGPLGRDHVPVAMRYRVMGADADAGTLYLCRTEAYATRGIAWPKDWTGSLWTRAARSIAGRPWCRHLGCRSSRPSSATCGTRGSGRSRWPATSEITAGGTCISHTGTCSTTSMIPPSTTAILTGPPTIPSGAPGCWSASAGRIRWGTRSWASSWSSSTATRSCA